MQDNNAFSSSNAWLLNRPSQLGMTLRPVRYGSFSWLAEQLIRCATLGEVYETTLRFYNLVWTGFVLD
jgi:hypothetical protein